MKINWYEYILIGLISISSFFLVLTNVRADTVLANIIFLNKCPDIDPNAVDWTCLNRTQGAQSSETVQQIVDAFKHVKVRKLVTIYSIDPVVDRSGDYNYGARVLHGRIYFAAMPGCPNARWSLERVLRSSAGNTILRPVMKGREGMEATK